MREWSYRQVWVPVRRTESRPPMLGVVLAGVFMLVLFVGALAVIVLGSAPR